MSESSRGSHSAPDPHKTPLILIWEVTQACDLACSHCRIEENRERSPGELSHDEGKDLIASAARMGTHVMVLTGGDPLQRPDLCELIEYGNEQGLRMATIPATTPRLTREKIHELRDAGCQRVALSLDGPNAEVHDGIRGETGTFDRLIQAAGWCHEAGIPLQINTVISATNADHFDSIRSRVESLNPVFWEVFFLVPTGDGRGLEMTGTDQTKEIFEKLYATAQDVSFGVKVTEAPHYRRFCIEKKAEEWGVEFEDLRNGDGPFEPPVIHRNFTETLGATDGNGPSSSEIWKGVRRRAWGINSGRGFILVSHEGEVFPSGFLPRSAGNVRDDTLEDLYRNSAFLRQLRDPEQLNGRCGRCEYRSICSGSRSRAHATSGSFLAEDPLCWYE